MNKEKLYELGKNEFKRVFKTIPNLEECEYEYIEAAEAYILKYTEVEECSDEKTILTMTVTYDLHGYLEATVYEEIIKHYCHIEKWNMN